MPPVYRVAQALTSDIAEVPQGATLQQILKQQRQNLRDQQQALARSQAADRKRLVEKHKEHVRLAKIEHKKGRSKSTLAKQEQERKVEIRKARKCAEYDIYKQAMLGLGVHSVLTLDAAHKRAVAFAEHVVRHSPSGHQDVGFVGRCD